MSSLRLRQEIKSRRSRSRRIESGYQQHQNGLQPLSNENSEPDIIACIDIGTTYSGYAFALRKDLEEDRLGVHVNKEWISGNSKLTTLKVPSTVLLTPEKRFHSFGYEAEWKYGQLAADKNHLGWYYFRKFKMTMMQSE
ncbi:heat shock 70 kDa protein 12A-like, partial [Saccostrea cucullata]|uniref:heat shock 70 kDa protein 12A-like n=1 Tax=Saccostrea cuccullata TaxID=36930 RepID=UPI002ED644A7